MSDLGIQLARNIEDCHSSMWREHARKLQALALQVSDPTLRIPLLTLAAEAKARGSVTDDAELPA